MLAHPSQHHRNNEHEPLTVRQEYRRTHRPPRWLKAGIPIGGSRYPLPTPRPSWNWVYELRIPKLKAMLQSEQSLRLKPHLWGTMEKRVRHEAALRRAELLVGYDDFVREKDET